MSGATSSYRRCASREAMKKLILTARLGRTGEFAKSIGLEGSEEGIMVWSFNIFGQDKDIRGLFVNGSSDPRGNTSACGSVI